MPKARSAPAIRATCRTEAQEWSRPADKAGLSCKLTKSPGAARCPIAPRTPRRRPLPGIFQITPLNPEFNENPHRLLDRLRSSAPGAARSSDQHLDRPSKHADVRGVLSDLHHVASSQARRGRFAGTARRRRTPAEGLPPPDRAAPTASILLLDDPDHARIRGPLAKALYKRVAKCRPLVQQIVDEKLDAIGDAKTFDAMAQFALLVPIDAIARILGVDNARLSEFRAWSEDVILALNPFCTPEETARFVKAGNALSEYMHEMMARRRATAGRRSRFRHDGAEGGRRGEGH